MLHLSGRRPPATIRGPEVPERKFGENELATGKNRRQFGPFTAVGSPTRSSRTIRSSIAQLPRGGASATASTQRRRKDQERGGRREGRGSSATRPLLVFGHRGRAHSRLQKTLCAAPSSVPMKSPAAGGGVPSRPPAGRKGSTSQSMLRRARLSNTPESRE